MSLRDQIAAELNGSEYPLRLTKDLIDRAKAGRILIVYGASDDLMEFDGAFSDELGAYDGGEAALDSNGLLDRSQIDSEDDEAIHDFVVRKRTARRIEALWDRDGYSWTYQTDIPHATFELLEDGEKYCRGIVIDLADLTEQTQPSTTDAAEKSRDGEACWSIDGETYNHDSLSSVIADLIGRHGFAAGATVYRGTANKPAASNFVDADIVIDSMRDRAGDEYSEWADDFPDVSEEGIAELDGFLNAWAEKHCEVTFYRVDDITEYVITEADVTACAA